MKRMMKMNRLVGAVTALGILVGSIALAALLVSLAPGPEIRDLPPQFPFVLTGETVAGSGPVPVFAAGVVSPAEQVELAAEVGGRIVWVDPALQTGARVAAGQPLLRIEDADYRHRLEIAEANLAASEVAVLEAEQRAAIAAVEFEAFAQRQGADAMTSPNPLALHEPQLQAAQAAVARDAALLAQARLALARTEVSAPFDAFVGEESVAVGQIVVPGQPLARLFSATDAEVAVSLPDSDAALLPGLWGDSTAGPAAARVTVSHGAASYSWQAEVHRSRAEVDPRTRTIDVIVRVAEPFEPGSLVAGADGVGGAPPLLVGQFVEVRIAAAAPDRWYRLPRAALQPGDEVWVVNAAGEIGIVTVQVLQRVDDEAYVVGALQAGQRVVTGGIGFATEGMRVLVEGAPPQ